MYPLSVVCGNKIAMLLFCFVCFNASYLQAQCIATSAHTAAVANSVSYAGSTYAFDDPLNARVNDGYWATASSVLQLLGDRQTEYLQVKDFGFNIPTAASICGIEVNVIRSATNVDLVLHTASVKDYDVRVMKTGGPVGTNAYTTTEWPSSDGTATYGGNGALWGTTWSPADVNSPDFGFSISAKIHGTATLFPTAQINYITITVYYLNPGTLTQQALQFQITNGANHSAVLSWKSNAADEGALFAVERSVNGIKWQPVQCPPKQNFTSPVFTFTDAQPLPGQSFYRLKIIGASGDERYSTIQPFEFIDHLFLECYPNPITNIVQIAGIIPGEPVMLSDMYGKCLFQSRPALNNLMQLDVAHLQAGMYVIGTRTRKIKVLKK
jgi:hypothetical protein